MANEVALGGMFISRPEPILLKKGQPLFHFGIRLMSDLHIGARNIDYDLITEELEDAKQKGDRILINGDVFDMILVQDKKRFRADCVHPKISGKADMIDHAVKWGAEILGPYADMIDMIGIGNHEEAVTKHHSCDVTKHLLYELRHKKKNKQHTIHYGGYTGFVSYSFKAKEKSEDSIGGNSRALIIFYHHGAGGAAPVTKGMIDLHRFGGWITNADVIWIGHKHTRIMSSVQTISCPRNGHEPTVKDVKQVITGSYFDTYRGQTQDSLEDEGRITNYAADRGMAPQGKGGARLTALVAGRQKQIRVKVEQ